MNSFLRWSYRVISPVCDPRRLIRSPFGYIKYIWQWQRYSRLSGAERLLLRNAYPILGEDKNTTFDPHYVYQACWAMQKIRKIKPQIHVDISSDHRFVSLIGADLKTISLDFRPLKISFDNFIPLAGDILNLPFKANSLGSLSCLHVIEHIGLGRYGEPLDPMGTRKACVELSRVLARGGDLYLSLPIGRRRVCFNAQRILAAEEVVDYLKPLELEGFSGVGDDRKFIVNADVSRFNNDDYACGMFWFKKK